MKTSVRILLALMAIVMVACDDTPIESIKIPETLSLYVDSTSQLTCQFTPVEAVGVINWCSNNEAVATVNAQGVVLGVQQGQAIIMAQVGDKLSACQVTVKNNPVVLDLEVLDVKQKVCTVAVAASNSEGYYYCGYAEKSIVDKASDEALKSSVIASLQNTIKAYAAYGYSYTLKDLLQQGSKNLIASGMTANTEYTMFAFGIDVDNVNKTSSVTRTDYTTLPVVPSSNTFVIVQDSITQTGTTTVTTKAWFTVTPSVEADKYAVQIVSVAILDSLYSGDAMTYMQAAETYYNQNYASYGGMDAITKSGTNAVYTKNPEVGTTYRVIVVGYDAGFTTEITTFDWKYEAPSVPVRRSASNDDSQLIKSMPIKPFVKGACYSIEQEIR